jgi:glycosyltransferase involved in cell wall biosynthesis
MAARVMQLLSNDALRLSMSEFAATIVSRSFTVKQQVEAYLEWYEQLLSPSRMEREPAYAC